MENYILVIAAVREELESLINTMRKTTSVRLGRREVFLGFVDDKEVKTCVTGPGIINTVQALTAIIEEEAPFLIIQSGCAGAFKDSGLNIGDVGIATEEIDIHSGLENNESKEPVKELPFPVLKINDAEVKNRLILDEHRVEDAFQILKKSRAAQPFKIKKGPFITTQTITTTDQRSECLYQTYRPLMEQMEGAGSAHVAAHYEIPFIEIRSASNIVGRRNKMGWNLPLAFKNGALAVMDYMKHMVLHG